MVGVDQLQMDLSSSGLVIAIAHFFYLFYFMILDLSPHQLDVWSLAPLDSFDARLVDSQGDRLVPLS